MQTFNKAIYYQVDNNPVAGGPENGLLDGEWSIQNNNNWRWVKIGHNLSLSQGSHTLRLFQGSSGFSLDKIIITNNPGHIEGTTLTDFMIDGAEGPAATSGSATREACNMCNPAFGNGLNNLNDFVMAAQCSCKTGPGDTVVDIFPGGGTGLGCTRLLENTNQLDNDLFHDVDPLRSAQKAVWNLTERLDPTIDQIGSVMFSTSVYDRVKLQCLQYAAKHLPGGVQECYDPATDAISFTHVLAGIENAYASGSTNIAQGLKEGLEELGISIPIYNPDVTSDCISSDIAADNKDACNRQGAAQPVLILMTDGLPDTNNGAGCPADSIWRGRYAGGGGNDAHNCALYYAGQAAGNSVAVYIIGIGAGVNRELLTAMATGTDPDPVPGDDGFYFEQACGEFFLISNLNQLESISAQIVALARSCGSPSTGPIYMPVIYKSN